MGFPIPLPIIDEQRRIVNMLKSDIQMTDKAVDAIDRQTALLGERRQALITSAVTGQKDVATARGI